MNTITIAVLLTVFNRKEKTLKCLERLYAQLPISGYKVDVYLTNDGCTDGTPEAVRTQFSDVHVIDAEGDLFWNRGMFTAWAEAAKTDYDFYLWLNDDTFLFDNAVETMLESSNRCGDEAVIVAAMRSKDKEVTTYSGHKKGKKVTPNGELQECETLNGNFVLVPRCVFKKVGNLDWTFRHAIGDIDYGYRVRRAGFKIYVAPVYLGICEDNPKLPAWARSEVPLRKRIKNLYSPLGYAEPLPFFHFERKNHGLFIALKHFVTIHVRVLFPGLWRQ